MDSGSLRLWILIVGALLIGGVYGWGKWQERRTHRGARIEPEVGKDLDAIPILTERRTAGGERDSPPLEEGRNSASIERARAAPSPKPAAPPKEVILTFGVLAPRGREFTGGELAQALRKAGMVYGAMNIFHAPADFERPDGPALFSLANILEPGTLEPDRLRLLATPGVLLFAQLPGPIRGTEILDHMYATGRFLAQELRGELCDDRRQPFTAEKAEELRSRILSDIGDTVRKPDF